MEYIGWINTDDSDAEECFPAFRFESNQAFGIIRGLESLNVLLRAYDRETILGARESVHAVSVGACPDFGLRAEHRGQRTLAEFFAEHGYAWEKAQEGQ